MMGVETYGRWPHVAAAALGPAWAMALGNRRRLARGGWVAGLALPILLAHQTEEWVKPGGFLPFANERLLGAGRPTWPLTERIGFHVNVTAGWGSAIAGLLLWRRSPGLAAGVVAMEIGNVAMHAGMAVRERHYNPGLVTAVTLMAPHAIGSVRWLKRSGRMTRTSTATAAVVGAAFAALPVAMKLRLRGAVERAGSAASPAS
jgi:hypothetical protein